MFKLLPLYSACQYIALICISLRLKINEMCYCDVLLSQQLLPVFGLCSLASSSFNKIVSQPRTRHVLVFWH